MCYDEHADPSTINTIVYLSYSKSDVCMANNGKDIKHTRIISRRVNFVRNCENCKLHTIDWCEGGLKLADIATKNVGENNLNYRMIFILVILDNSYKKLVQEG